MASPKNKVGNAPPSSGPHSLKKTPERENKMLRRRLVELESEFETALRFANDPFELFEHLLGSNSNSSQTNNNTQLQTGIKRPNTGDGGGSVDTVPKDWKGKAPEEKFEKKEAEVDLHLGLAHVAKPEEVVVSPSPKRLRTSPAQPKISSQPLNNLSHVNFEPKLEKPLVETASTLPEFDSSELEPPLVHQGVFEALRAEQKSRAEQIRKNSSLPPPQLDQPPKVPESPSPSITRVDDIPLPTVAKSKGLTTNPLIPGRALDLFVSPLQKNEESRDLSGASVQSEVIKHINNHHGAQRNFSFRDISRRVNLHPLAPHIKTAHKPLSLEDWKILTLELEAAKLNEKVDQLISKNSWSYRQPRRQQTIQRPLAHWDRVLEEMQWIHTDFAEEKKWKIHMAAHIAHSVVNWHLSANRSELVTRRYFRQDGTVNPEFLGSRAPSIFDVNPDCMVVDGQLNAYKDMPVYNFQVDDKTQYRDIVERGPLVPASRLMETFVQFQPGSYSSSVNPTLGMDFQSYSLQTQGAKRKTVDGETEWLEAEDQFVRKQAPELGFNWGLVAELLNSSTSLSNHKRTAQECSARWPLVSNAATETIPKEESNDTSIPRFQILEKAKVQAQVKREYQMPVDKHQSADEATPEEKPFVGVLELIQAKVEAEEALKCKSEPKGEAHQPAVVTSLATPPLLPRLAPAQPTMHMARPSIYPSLQALNYMRNGVSISRPPPDHPGIRPFPPNSGMNMYNGSSNSRMVFPMPPLRPGTAISSIDLSTAEGRRIASQLYSQRDFLAHKMMQIQQSCNRSSQPMHMAMSEQQRHIVRHIHENASNYSLPATSQIRPRIPINGHPPAASPPSALSPQGSQKPPPITSFLQPPPDPPKSTKPKSRPPKKTTTRKRNQKPPPETTPQPPTSSAVATPSPHAPSPHTLQFMSYGSTQQPPAQARYSAMPTHMVMPHYQQRPILPSGQTLQFMPPQLGPPAPSLPTVTPNNHPPSSLGPPPNCRQDGL